MARRRLTRRQLERIRRRQAAQRERLAHQAEARLAQARDAPARKGRVIRRHGQNLRVRDEAGVDHHCLFRQNLGDIVCGDRVLWQPVGDGQGVVVALLPRDTVLSRRDYAGHDKPLAANVTQLVVVLAPRPEPTGYLADQYLVAAELMGAKGLVVLNKADLLDADALDEFRRRFAHYESIGYPVITASAHADEGLDLLRRHLAGETSILVGQSGVGKSSLINALIPHRPEVVGDLSPASGLGRHTTSAATLHSLDNGAELIDSPGVRSFRPGRIDRKTLEKGFREFAPWLGRCRFSNCSHDREPGCALREAAERGEIPPQRLESFLRMAAKLEKES